jgi:hypothetical protein
MKTFASFAIFCSTLLLATAAQGATLVIGGAPLEIRAEADGTVGVLREVGGGAVPQYYATFAKGSALFLEGTNAARRWGNGAGTFVLWDDAVTGGLQTVSHGKPDAGTIRTVLNAGASGVRVTQTLSYTNGNHFYDLRWEVANRGEGSFSDLRFIHGGDVSPAGEDFALGSWLAASNMVAAETAGAAGGFMGLMGTAGTPAAGYMEGHFQLVREAAKGGSLGNGTAAGLHDAAYALQWNRARLRPGETWTVSAREVWPGEEEEPPTGIVAVSGPPPVAAAPGSMVTSVFGVVNQRVMTDTFALSVASSLGWPWALAGGSNVSLAAWAATSVAVRVTVPGTAGGATNVLTLTATSVSNPEITDSAPAIIVAELLTPPPPPTGVWHDVTGRLLHPLFESWELRRQTGTYFGRLRLRNAGGEPFSGPFVLAIEVSPAMRFMHPTGKLADGRPTLDLTSQVVTAQPDGRLDPGDTVVIPEIEVYMKYRHDPPDTAFAVWATRWFEL